MPNIKLILEYDGSFFHGWQEQPGVRTIQRTLHDTLETILRLPIRAIIASGRTDAGVHARGQVVNFHVPEAPDLRRLAYAVSSLLKGQLAVLSAEIVPDDFHAQRSAITKQYRYRMLLRSVPPVLDYSRVWHLGPKLDISRMQAAAAELVGTHDFTSVRAGDCTSNSPIKTITESSLEFQDGELVYRVIGNGFLKHMVRNIVGTLVWLGQGKLSFGSMAKLLALKDRTRAGMTAPAFALCLDWVKYSDSKTTK